MVNGKESGEMTPRDSENAAGTIGVFPNIQKEGSLELSRKILRWLEDRDLRGVVPSCISNLPGFEGSGLPVCRWPGSAAFAVVLGGDGTLLGAARTLGPRGIPLLGVNLGHFGFLTELEQDSLFDMLPTFLAGEVKRDERTTICAEVIRNGQRAFKKTALNEACIIKGPYGRMTGLVLSVSGCVVDTYFGDGLIVSTPTGSTAYSLSAGGPLMVPDLDALLVTPVCAHTLYARSMVLSSTELCEITVAEPSQSTTLSLDGQEFFSLERLDVVRVYASDVKVVLLRRKDWSFYDVLRRKMKEGADRLPR